MAHQKEMNARKSDAQALTVRLTKGETLLSALDRRVLALEERQDSHTEALITQQLHLEDMEDQSHMNNLRLRGSRRPRDPRI